MQAQTVTRADGTEVHAQILQRGPGRKNVVTALTEPVVDPRGNVIDALINTRLEHAGLTWVRKVEGQLVLTEHAREHGMVFYRDMCLGRVPDVAASTIHWRIYEKITAVIASGKRIPTGALSEEDLWHPEVLARRANNVGGFEQLDKSAVDTILDELRASPESDADAEAAAKTRGMSFESHIVPPSSDAEVTESLAEMIQKGRTERGK